PHELPHGMSAEGVGLRAPVAMGAAIGARTQGAPMQAVSMSAPMGAPMPSAPMPSAPMPVAKRAAEGSSGGIKGWLSRLVKGDAAEELEASAEEEAAAPEPVAPKKAAPKKAKQREEAAPARRTLRGRVALQREDAVIVEITVDGAGLDWAPEGEVELVLADGSVVRASVVTTLSTRAGQLGGGQTARLGVALRGMLGAPLRRVVLRRGGVELVIEL
ncbi:MAG TPA: hypothetical protein VLS89_17140, partial [Candidatus Nanopelagicales bacterium]|nr:hypothetical protein [Candidatus Nanopelagicales bacterium]